MLSLELQHWLATATPDQGIVVTVRIKAPASVAGVRALLEEQGVMVSFEGPRSITASMTAAALATVCRAGWAARITPEMTLFPQIAARL